MSAAIREEAASVRSGADPLGALFARPAGGPDFPGVLVLPDVHGLDPFARGATRRLAEAGFAVLAPDLFSREGELRTEADARARESATPDRRAVADAHAAFEDLASRPGVDASRLAAVGFGLGGRHAFLLGCRARGLAAVASLGGALVDDESSADRPTSPVDFAGNLEAAWLGVYGAGDPAATPRALGLLRDRLRSFGRDFEIVVVADAAERYFDDTRPSFRPVAAGVAWDRLAAFLRGHLG